MKDLRFGIEIEFVTRDPSATARAIAQVVGGEVIRGVNYPHVKAADGRVWKLVRDASLIAPEGYMGVEAVSPILHYADLDHLQGIVRAIRSTGGKVNESCGIHVHVDAATLEARHIVNLVKLVYKQEEIIEAALGIHAGRKRYCKSIDPAFVATLNGRRSWTLDALNQAWYGYLNRTPYHYDNTRYRAINLHAVWEKGTVEFRWGNGTLHAGVIKTYVQFALALVHKAKTMRGAHSGKRTYNPGSAKYDLRVFLLGLKLIGPEFKTARFHLLRAMPGNAAWKHGPPTRTRNAPAEAEEGA